ncbi:MAG: ATP-grasp fold amidoligase family protein [Hyphomicrobiales bacterium]
MNYPHLDFDEALIRATYQSYFGEEINLEHPQTLAEKLNWLKLNDRRDLLSKVVDKWEMREYVQEKGLSHLLNDVFGVFETPNEIDFQSLPESYALKVAHGAAMNIIKAPGQELDPRAAKRKLLRWQKTDMDSAKGEWQYRNAKRRIVAEKFLASETGQIADYKFFCLNGVPKFITYMEPGPLRLKCAIFDANWVRLPFHDARTDCIDANVKLPSGLREMTEAATALSKDFPILSADFYQIGEKVILGEHTLYPNGGFPKFLPVEYNTEIGKMLCLDSSNL